MTAADRPSVPRVGDTITNPDQLDALPVGVVMRARNDLLTETGRLGADGMRVVWGEGWSDHAAAIEHLAPLTVLYMPGEPSRPSVTDDARAIEAAVRARIVADIEALEFTREAVRDLVRFGGSVEWSEGHDDAVRKAARVAAGAVAS